jgi:hypothetical protein
VASLLSIVENVSLKLGLPVPTQIIGSTDILTRQYLSLAHETMINLKRRHDWPELQKEHTFDRADRDWETFSTMERSDATK